MNTKHTLVSAQPTSAGVKLHSNAIPDDLELLLMTPEEWEAVPPIDVQRDTEKHATRIEKHLQTYASPHREVHAARLPDGELVKINGHSRDLLWRSGRVIAPDKLLVTVHKVDSMAHARTLYSFYDSATSVETVTDKVFGACRMLGLAFESSYCRDMRFSAALSPVSPASMTDRAERTAFWKDELLALDTLHVKRAQFINPVASIFLITTRKHGDKAMDFWRAVVGSTGIKDDQGYDAVEALGQWLVLMKQDGWGNGTSQKKIRDVVLGVVERWVQNPAARYEKPRDIARKPIDLITYKKALGL
ncbi:hypothetical protein [Paraburkholderia sp.]|uniref:hypothetical protein n=1 Tax=Paraburkholderia sp. TaxID=1926495 RepID=UPI0039E68964